MLDKTARIVREHDEVIFDRNGKAVQFDVTVQDITEFKRWEEILLKPDRFPERHVKGQTAALLKTNEELYREISKRKEVEEKIRYLLFHDPLTNLPNRLLLNERFNLASAHADHKLELLAVMFLDLDRFKTINDTLGHTVGDRLLQDIASYFKTCINKNDTLARISGDDFILLLTEIIDVEQIHSTARKFLNVLKQSWIIENHELYITCSIGIAIYPNDGKDAETLLKNAAAAANRTKEMGGNSYQFYTPSMHAKSFERMSLERGLRRALKRREFVVYYQPQVNLDTGQITGLEALIRWIHPYRGLVSPVEFLSLAEDTRLITSIDEMVLHSVCAQNKAWQRQGIKPWNIAVNLSTHTFHQQHLVEFINSVLKNTGLDPHHLALEITESIAMQDTKATIFKLKKLSNLGIQIIIDDFGMGFSSLCYLKKFILDKLKISQDFVRGIITDQSDKIIVTSVIDLAHSLNLRVIAEGVETKDQLIFLKQLQCDEFQGHFFCKPMSTDDFWKMATSKGNHFHIPCNHITFIQ